MQVVLLEDRRHACFGPLTLLRPQFDLRCGALTLREKLECARPDWRVALHPAPELADVVSESCPGRGLDGLEDGPVLVLYGRVLFDDALLKVLETVDGERILTAGPEVVGARLEEGARERLTSSAAASEGVGALGLSDTKEVPARTVRYPWDLVAATPDEIVADVSAGAAAGQTGGEHHHCVRLIDEDGISTGEGSEIGPSAVLDARRGPVVVGRNVEIMPNAVIVGPAFIGDGSVIRAGATIYGGTSIGPVCKVGGEVQASVLQSFSNKQHGGFLGHSFVGSWVNIGAGTNNSDLKNNYGDVRVELEGETLDTGSNSVGVTVGDHTKTAIGTRLNTGTVVGAFCSVMSNGFAPKSIPSFSWGTQDGYVRHDLEQAVETARVVMARRGEAFTPALEARVRAVHDAGA